MREGESLPAAAPQVRAKGSRLFVHGFDAAMTVRENVAGDVPASLTTMVWNAPSKSWTGGATMADASLNRRGSPGPRRGGSAADSRGAGRARGRTAPAKPGSSA
jgi:hypothetical protein